jgi:hypothetical protein
MLAEPGLLSLFTCVTFLFHRMPWVTFTELLTRRRGHVFTEEQKPGTPR